MHKFTTSQKLVWGTSQVKWNISKTRLNLISQIFYLPNFQNCAFLQWACIEYRRKLCSNPLSQLVVLPALSRPSGIGICQVLPRLLDHRGRFKNTYELLNLRAVKISILYKNYIFQCMGMIFCVEFQKVPLKFHTKYLTQTLKDVDFIHSRKFESS